MKTTLGLALVFIVALAGGYYWYTARVSTPPAVTADLPEGTYTRDEVATHNTAQDCWSSINGGVYNLSSWIGEHPGGQAAILSLCGKDGTEAFAAEHARNKRANDTLTSFKIGTLTQ